MTLSQMRAMRAKQLLDSGKEPADVARELGYTKVSGMLGAIALCSRKIERNKKKILQMIAEEPPKVTSKIVMEDGVRAEIVFHTDEPVIDLLADGHVDPIGDLGEPGEPGAGVIPMTREEHVQAHFYPRISPGWLALYGKHMGREKLAATLREIAKAATEAAALIEEVSVDVDHHA